MPGGFKLFNVRRSAQRNTGEILWTRDRQLRLAQILHTGVTIKETAQKLCEEFREPIHVGHVKTELKRLGGRAALMEKFSAELDE